MTERARPRSRRLPVILAGLAAAVLAVDTAAWLVVTGRMLDTLPVALEEAGREGWTVRTGVPSRGGWPLAARVTLPGATAARDLGGTRIVLALDSVDLVLRPAWRPALRIEAGRAGSLQIGDSAAIPLRTDTAIVRVPFDQAAPTEVSLRNLVAGNPGSGLAIGLVALQGAGGVLSGSVGPITPDPPLPPPFDTGGTLNGRVHVVPPIPAKATPAASAAAWQAAGGRVQIPNVVLTWGPVRVEGRVEAGLDPALQPFGAADLRVQGAAEALDGASRAGLLAPGPASAVRAVLGLLTLAAHGGPVPLPVTLRDRTLMVAQFSVLRLPTIEWAR